MIPEIMVCLSFFTFAYIKGKITLDCLILRSIDFRWAYLIMTLANFPRCLNEQHHTVLVWS